MKFAAAWLGVVTALLVPIRGTCQDLRAVTRNDVGWRVLPELTVRRMHALCYDPVRQRTVMFGGLGGCEQADTWEWDGQQWMLRRPLTSPPPRFGHSMAFDPVRGTVLMFGGLSGTQTKKVTILQDLWEWDGRNWQSLTPSVMPRARYAHAMATDAGRSRIVMFGGALTYTIFGGLLASDTWEWDGSQWIQMLPSTVPDARAWAGIAYSLSTQRVTLFGGGMVGSGVPDDTWEWSGTDWIRYQTSQTGSPGRRIGCAGGNDPMTGHFVVHGGLSMSANKGVNDVWTWDGTAWRQVQTAVAPPVHDSPALANDSKTRRLVLWGGSVDLGQPGSGRDTWIWDGTNWGMAQSLDAPVGYYTGVYVPSRDHVLLMASQINPPDMWTWSEAGFVRVQPITIPPQAFVFQPMAYHAGSDRVLYHTGTQGTWLWDGTDWSRVQGANFRGVGLIYDSGRDKVLCIGAGSHWEWDPTNQWIEYKPTVRPLAIFAWDYDPVRRRTVVLAPSRTNGNPAETWEWDGANWLQATPPDQPPSTAFLASFMPALGGVVLCAAGQDSWLWSGTTWIALGHPLPSSLAGYSFLTHDSRRQRLLAFSPSASITEFGPSTLWPSTAEPWGGSQVDLYAELQGHAGDMFVLALSGASLPGIPLRTMAWGTEVLPLAPDALFDASLQAGMRAPLDSAGRATFRLSIPNDPALWWLPVKAAGFAVGSGTTVSAITNPVSLLLVK